MLDAQLDVIICGFRGGGWFEGVVGWSGLRSDNLVMSCLVVCSIYTALDNTVKHGMICVCVPLSQCVLLSVGTETCSSIEAEPPDGLLPPEPGKTSVITPINPWVQQLLSLVDELFPNLRELHRYFALLFDSSIQTVPSQLPHQTLSCFFALPLF